MRQALLLSLALLVASTFWLGATPAILVPPKVVVFPLTVNGEAQADSGERLAVLFAQQMSENGVQVVPPTPGTQRSDFLIAARKLGCDYYITGFLTPLGAEVTVVEQIVSTTSGTVVASNSAELLTYADASGQGSLLATLVRRHAERALAPLNENGVASTPEPKESGPQTSLSKLGNIFKRKPKAAATPSPSVSPTASP